MSFRQLFISRRFSQVAFELIWLSDVLCFFQNSTLSETVVTEEWLLSTTQFHWADYLVFVLVLAASCGVGLYYAFCQKNNTTDDYLMGGRNMAVLPVTLSLYISFISAISFLGDPVEVYKNGSVQVSMVIGYTLALIFMAVFVVPQFHKTQITSAYEVFS